MRVLTQDALDIAMKMALDIPLPDISAYRKVGNTHLQRLLACRTCLAVVRQQNPHIALLDAAAANDSLLCGPFGSLRSVHGFSCGIAACIYRACQPSFLD